MSNSEQPNVSIVIVNYNGAHHLDECLTSLKEIDYQTYQVVLVDNASSDNSVEFVTQNFPGVKIIQLQKNHGFSEGSNIGVSHSTGEYIVFLNNDTKVERNWLSELVKEIISDPSIATCGSKMLFYGGNIINHAGSAITLLGNGYDIGFRQEDSTVFDIKKIVGSTCGGSMIIRKEVFTSLGGFDPGYFACAEDVDLCLRAWIYGFKNVYVPASVVYHKYGSTLGKRHSPKRVYICQKNRLANILKNFEPVNVLKGLCLSIPYDCIRIAFCLYKLEIKTALLLVKAYFDVLSSSGSILEKRKLVQENRKVPDSVLMKGGIITQFKEGVREFYRLSKLR